MRICTVTLSDFRRFSSFQFDCHPKLNCIIGENGTGKTSILEAIWTGVAASSFRTHRMNHLVHAEKKEAKIALDFETDSVAQQLTFCLKGSKKEIQHNQTRVTPSNLIGLLLGVIISTEDLDLVEGAPDKRRYFLDLMLSQIDPLYLWHMRRYMKGLKSKNHLLKTRHLKPIPFFEEEMAKSGAYISEKRHHLSRELSIQAAPFLKLICLKEATLDFQTKIWSAQELKAQWNKERSSELHLGYTLSGPHREDLKISHNGTEAKHFASMGEKKSLLIALKLAQSSLIHTLSGHQPFLLIDDFTSHLDSNRQENFFKILSSFGQVFLTNPTPPPHFQEGQLLKI